MALFALKGKKEEYIGGPGYVAHRKSEDQATWHIKGPAILKVWVKIGDRQSQHCKTCCKSVIEDLKVTPIKELWEKKNDSLNCWVIPRII